MQMGVVFFDVFEKKEVWRNKGGQQKRDMRKDMERAREKEKVFYC